VEITDFPFVFDNSYYLNYNVQPYLMAIALYDGKFGDKTGMPYLRALFRDDAFVVMESNAVENLQVSKLGGYNVIFVLNCKFLTSGLVQELKKAAGNGATILFFPEPEGDFASYNDFLSQLNANTIVRSDTASLPIDGIEFDHPVFNQVFSEKSNLVDFPVIKGRLVFTENTRVPESNLLWFRNKSKAVSIQPFGEGNLAVFSFPLSRLNDAFAQDLLFVPLVYAITLNSTPYQKLCYKIGTESYATLPGQLIPDFSNLRIQSNDSVQEYIPSVEVLPGNRLKINFMDYFREAGHYLVRSSGKTVSAISMNYDRSESDLRFFSSADLVSEIGKFNLKNTRVLEAQKRDFSQVYNEIRNGRKLWKMFLIMAILFLASEVIIIRFWK
jgi:hypothetical protein